MGLRTHRDWLLVKHIHREVYKQRLIVGYIASHGGLVVEVHSNAMASPMLRSTAVKLATYDNILTARRFVDRLDADNQDYRGADHD